MNQLEVLINYVVNLGMVWGTKLVGAIVLWIVGRMLVGFVRGMVRRLMTARELDATLTRYIDSALGVLLDVLLVIAVLGVFGVETTTFAGLLAAAGVAIGMAWSGLLANFAAGAFMLVLRPFTVGDYVEVAGTQGTVLELGMLVTTINTPDNIRTFIGNNAVFSGQIKNFTANPSRRVELVAQLDHTVDLGDAIARLKTALAAIPNVTTTPAPEVHVLTFTLAGPVLAVRPHVHNDHYWQVYFDTNRAIADTCGTAGYEVPKQHFTVVQQAS